MAEKKVKSQTEKVASAQKDKASKKNASAKKEAKVSVKTPPQERQVPVRVITSVVFFFAFVLLLIIFFKPRGLFGKKVEKKV